MSEDEMYDIIRGYEESERDYHERNIELEAENAKLRELASLMAVHWLPNDVRMTSDEWHDRDELIRGKLRELGIEVKDD